MIIDEIKLKQRGIYTHLK